MAKTDIEEKIEREIWEVLRQLKRDHILTTETKNIFYEVVDYPENKEYPSKDNQRKIIQKLYDAGVISIYHYHYASPKSPYNNALFAEITGAKPTIYEIKLVEEKFDDMFSKYQNKFSNTHISIDTKKKDNLYVNEEGEGIFRYKGRILPFSDNFPCKVFKVLYKLLPEGGEVTYTDLEIAIQKMIPEKKNLTKQEMRKFILTNLTDRYNGFMAVMKIRETMYDEKNLIWTKRGKAIVFNNKKQ